MKIMLLTDDNKLIKMGQSFSEIHALESEICSDKKNPLDVVQCIYKAKPSVIVIDDDFICPNSATLIKTLKMVKKNLKIIFLTSDSSVELGKEISQLAINFYAVKPLEEAEFEDLLLSILKTNNKTISSNK